MEWVKRIIETMQKELGDCYSVKADVRKNDMIEIGVYEQSWLGLVKVYSHVVRPFSLDRNTYYETLNDIFEELHDNGIVEGTHHWEVCEPSLIDKLLKTLDELYSGQYHFDTRRHVSKDINRLTVICYRRKARTPFFDELFTFDILEDKFNERKFNKTVGWVKEKIETLPECWLDRLTKELGEKLDSKYKVVVKNEGNYIRGYYYSIVVFESTHIVYRTSVGANNEWNYNKYLELLSKILAHFPDKKDDKTEAICDDISQSLKSAQRNIDCAAEALSRLGKCVSDIPEKKETEPIPWMPKPSVPVYKVTEYINNVCGKSEFDVDQKLAYYPFLITQFKNKNDAEEAAEFINLYLRTMQCRQSLCPGFKQDFNFGYRIVEYKDGTFSADMNLLKHKRSIPVVFDTFEHAQIAAKWLNDGKV